MNLVTFGCHVLWMEGLTDWGIRPTYGDEGFCNRKDKMIFIGTDAIDKENCDLMLHEIAHCLTDNYHRSEEFKRIHERLKAQYLPSK